MCVNLLLNIAYSVFLIYTFDRETLYWYWYFGGVNLTVYVYVVYFLIMAVKTYGEKPLSFQLEENGEYYCIGSEVIYVYNSVFYVVCVEMLLNRNCYSWQFIQPGLIKILSCYFLICVMYR